MKQVTVALWEKVEFRSNLVSNNKGVGKAVLSGKCRQSPPTVSCNQCIYIFSGPMSQTMLAYVTVLSQGTSAEVIKSII